MAWEQRGNRRYYYRSRREGGRVVKDYVGGGQAGERAWLIDDTDRLLEACRRGRIAEAISSVELGTAAIAARTVELHTLGEGLARAALLLAGYRRHDRGEWRRRPVPAPQEDMDMTQAAEATPAPLVLSDPSAPPPAAVVTELVRRAEANQPKALTALRSIFATFPTIAAQYGDLAKTERVAWLGKIEAPPVYEAAIRASLEHRCRELAGPEPSPLESLLVERIVLAELETRYWSTEVARSDGEREVVEYLARRQERAEARLLAATTTLARVRRLLSGAPTVAVQLNLWQAAGNEDKLTQATPRQLDALVT